MKKIILFCLLFSFNSFSRPCDIAPFGEHLDLNSVTQKVLQRLPASIEVEATVVKQCIKALAEDVHTPPFPKGLFKKLGEEEILALHYPMNEEFESYLFVTDTGYRAIHLPKYRTETINLPGDIAHFRYNNKDYYLSQELGGEVLLMDGTQIAARAEELMISVASVHRKTKQYEDYLKSKNLFSSINVTTDRAIIDTLGPILQYHTKQTSESYMYGKFKSAIPDHNTMVRHHNQFQNLPEEDRVKYKRSFDDIRNEMVRDIHLTYPLCERVISQESIESYFDGFWGPRKRIYDAIHSRFYPNN